MRDLKRFTADWAISVLGTLVSLVAIVATLLAGISGPMSVALGLTGVATSLLFGMMQKLNEIKEEQARAHRELDQGWTRTESALRSVTETYDFISRGANLGLFDPEVKRLAKIGQASRAEKLDHILVEQAVARVRNTLDDLSGIADGRLQLDFTYSNVLLDLMRSATTEVLGSSPAEVEDVWWQLPLYREYLEIQRSLIADRGVRISRIFISENVTPKLYDLMEIEANIGINVKWVQNRRIQKSLRESFVVIDGRIMHRTVSMSDHDDDNHFSQNAADIASYAGKFHRLLPFSQDLAAVRPRT
ncbi:hypothetical protein [Verrucosispora sp. FIM060022]|uniref:hypothetical protein n=1 Tax=Verrucosispora sp. FIM060022 TaxID=1479020 RepID=UPI000F86D73B|nr:hypothetical protein [Verrucosispora sp. FIM060022]RUL90108.1 hypothetical protein EG812_27580 [Verrucosispora sp. FIM060022]